ncbi:hypothetical protein FE783_20790 [Paenibacillus mesophilus]|uniref:S-layer homology domain-containing protein n=1 Tax=Paenibacillus mesophilus TaxID=2582849 RepID=UPI00110F2EC1|nr:S-layer homology domain-containing protein [Paenibacillus mesophilus]TMV47866.1 hypothetical protein FE783_20790 [Paenibacillus mesophilus]
MKKSLPVLVSTAMLTSMWASIAFAAEPLTTAKKLETLIEAGIFDKDGTGNGAELDANVSREQLAKILVKLKGLKEQSGTSFTDVASDRWSAGFIQAVTQTSPLLMDGVADSVFAPSGDVTLEQLAAVIVRGLGLQPNHSGTVGGNVSDWAKGYVATAIANGLLGEKADFAKPATRAELAEASYAAKGVLDGQNKPAAVSVQVAIVSGIKKVTVTLDRDVDTTKASFTLTKGALNIALDSAATIWSDDKKTATLTVKDAKINEGDYIVTLGGLNAGLIGKASASFRAENESVKKLEFSAASDTVAKTRGANIPFKALNQYGEDTSFNPTDFTVTTPNFASTVKKDANGNFSISINTSTTLDGSPVFPNSTVIPIFLYENASRVAIERNYTLGFEPIIQKMELGAVKYPTDKRTLSVVGEAATIPVTLYDQYGNAAGYDSRYPDNWLVNVLIAPYSDTCRWEYGDFNNDNVGELKISLIGRAVKTEDVAVRAQIEGAIAATNLSISSGKQVAKIQFGAPSDSLYEAEEKDIFVPLTGFDESGNELTPDELVQDENYRKINISASSVKGPGKNGQVTLVKYGPYKGQLHIAGAAEGARAGMSAILNANLISKTGNNSFTTLQLPIQQVRIPSKISVVTLNAPKTVGGTAAFQMVVLDQYGKQLDKLPAVREQGRSVTYDVYVEYKGADGTSGQGDNDLKATRYDGVVYTTKSLPTIYEGEDVRNFNKAIVFGVAANGAGSGEKLDYIATIRKRVEGGNPTVIASSARSIVYINGSEGDFTYTVSKPTAMYATRDSQVLTTAQATIDGGMMDKPITVSAKDSSGDSVALVNSGIVSVTSSVYSVAQGKSSSPAGGTGYVIGYTPGKATMAVAYRTLGGGTKVAQVDVEVKAEQPVIGKATASAFKSMRFADITPGYKAWQLMGLSLVDQYGVIYSGANIHDYYNITGVIYTVETADPADAGLINVSNADSRRGDLTISDQLAPGVHYFALTAASGGKSASTYVKLTK